MGKQQKEAGPRMPLDTAYEAVILNDSLAFGVDELPGFDIRGMLVTVYGVPENISGGVQYPTEVWSDVVVLPSGRFYHEATGRIVQGKAVLDLRRGEVRDRVVRWVAAQLGDSSVLKLSSAPQWNLVHWHEGQYVWELNCEDDDAAVSSPRVFRFSGKLVTSMRGAASPYCSPDACEDDWFWVEPLDFVDTRDLEYASEEGCTRLHDGSSLTLALGLRIVARYVGQRTYGYN